MNAMLALMLDAYREMNAKRLFWISMAASAVVVAIFAVVGLSPKGVTLFGWQTPLEFGTNYFAQGAFYKLVYVELGIDLWISWAAMILAVISTAGIFPDFLASGSVDLYLSRPIGRLRLFLVKYACGLLFVALQVTAFSVVSFLVIGLRGGDWEPGLLLAVPLVVLMYSYLFGVCVLVGVLSRSTVAALLITLVFWAMMGGLARGERILLVAKTAEQQNAIALDRQIAQVQERLNAPAETAQAQSDPPEADATTEPSMIAAWTRSLMAMLGPAKLTSQQTLENQLQALRQQRSQLTGEFDLPQRIVYLIEAPLPKTTETIELLRRHLLSAANLPPVAAEDTPLSAGPTFRQRGRDRRIAQALVDQQMRKRPVWWIIGTSLAFEAAVVALAAGLFSRRDY